MAGLKAAEKSWPGAGLRLGLLTGILLFSGAAPTRAQDGIALMQKMVAAYAHLTSYEGHSNVDLTLTSNKRIVSAHSSSTQLQIQRPNKLMLVVYSSTGTRSVYSDGTNLTIYDALPNHYAVGPTAPTLAKLLPLLADRAKISAQFDPLYFLCENRLPTTVTGIKAAGSANVNGRDSLIVTGVVRARASTSSLAPGMMIAGITHWTWYIDKQTYLLNKVEMRSDTVNLPVTERQGGKQVKGTIPVVLVLRHNVSSFNIAPQLDAGTFTFKAPAGATEQKSAEQILKGGR